jgi:hypothetical protein
MSRSDERRGPTAPGASTPDEGLRRGERRLDLLLREAALGTGPLDDAALARVRRRCAEAHVVPPGRRLRWAAAGAGLLVAAAAAAAPAWRSLSFVPELVRAPSTEGEGPRRARPQPPARPPSATAALPPAASPARPAAAPRPATPPANAAAAPARRWAAPAPEGLRRRLPAGAPPELARAPAEAPPPDVAPPPEIASPDEVPPPPPSPRAASLPPPPPARAASLPPPGPPAAAGARGCSPGDESALLAQAVDRLRAGDARGALGHLDVRARACPRGLLAEEARIVRIRAHVALGEADAALPLLEAHPLGSDRVSDDLRLLRGELRARTSCAGAIEDFTAVLARTRSDAFAERALAGRAGCHAARGDEAAGAADARAYLARVPGGPRAGAMRRLAGAP